MKLFAELDQHLRNLNFHGARRLACAAETGSVRQVMVCNQPVIQWRENSADRTSINPAVSVSSHATVNWAGIEAGAAANAKQALPQRAAQNPRAAVVEDHKMEFLRP